MAKAKVAKTPAKASGAKRADPEVEIRRMAEVVRVLKREYPEAHCYLDYKTPFQLLIATILSAQCTDERVNLTTPALFAKYPDAAAMAKAKLPDLEKLVKSTGFYKAKAKSLHTTSTLLVENYGGELPRTIEELTKLRGVGRKTANVVLGNAFGIPSGVVVDTHVGRITRRLGFTKNEDPVKVEMDLQPLVAQADWTIFSHLLIAHGRAVCTARKAKCGECALARLCLKVGVTA